MAIYVKSVYKEGSPCAMNLTIFHYISATVQCDNMPCDTKPHVHVKGMACHQWSLVFLQVYPHAEVNRSTGAPPPK